MTDRHPANWTFGDWDAAQGIQFPSVYRDGEEVIASEFD
jgi:hypothetical protein